jgi:hypothetical protein
MRNIDPLELELVEEIAQGGQAHIYLAKFKGRGDLEVVVKRYKGCMQLMWFNCAGN